MTPHKRHYDLAVIGGGITGAGVALEAARRGLNIALYEQADFGQGASTATSKLAHGGLRYLEQFHFKLVQESLNERNFLLNSASHLVKPLQFYVPLYKSSKWKPWKLKIGLSIYDLLQTNRQLPKHEMVKIKKLKQDIPWLKTDELVGCGCYYDAQMDDHRLIIESLLMAQHEGANIQNYSKVSQIEKISSGFSFDILSNNKTVSESAHSMIIATGAWNNQFSQRSLVSPSKGIHIVLPDMDLSIALLLMNPKTHHVFFVMPWNGKTLLGTTQSGDDGRYMQPIINQDEVQYLLDSLNYYTNGRQWTIDDVKSAYCGYRPLVSTDNNDQDTQTREEAYQWLDSGMLSISGGKYTTFRQMAKRGVEYIVDHCFSTSKHYRHQKLNDKYIGFLSPNDWPSESQLNQLIDRFRVTRETVLHLIDTYGALYKDVLNIINIQPEYAIHFDIEHPLILAELKYAIMKEWAKTPADFLFRRTNYGYIFTDQHELLKSIIRQFNSISNDNTSSINDELELVLNKVSFHNA